MEKDELLESFLNKYNKEKLRNLTKEEYTSIDSNRDDFTYWVEIKLDCFGGIKGGSSYKFGIYKYDQEPKRKEDGYDFDKESGYAWVKNHGKTCKDAFENIRQKIVNVVNAASQTYVQFNKIEEIELGDAYKWKIAFLYSKKRLVPVYKKDVLWTAAKRLGIELEISPKEKITIALLQEKLVEFYNNHQTEYGDICSFGSYVWKIGCADLTLSNQIIKYGAPGTGKTFTAKKEAEEFFEVWKLEAQNTKENFSDHFEFVQFHPSYSYEDFIEGIKPVIINSKTELKLKNGIFKSFCKKAAQYELWLLDNISNKKLSDITVKDVKGKSDCPFCLPENVKDDDPITKYIPPYFFVIDEINRADLSRVFGELMYCLEYRGYKGRIKTQYSELEEGDTIFYEDKVNNQHYFFIPNNVYIIGTMNTIDRSIESFDFALRRRFLWQRVDPNKIVLQDYFADNKKTDFSDFIIPLWEQLNSEIANNTALLGEDYQIGHSYLMKLDKYKDCTKTVYRNIIWEKHIQPVLEEYFRGMGGESKSQMERLKNKFFSKPNSLKQNRKSQDNSSILLENEVN